MRHVHAGGSSRIQLDVLIHDVGVAPPLHVGVDHARSGFVHVEEPQRLLESFCQPTLGALARWVFREIPGGKSIRAVPGIGAGIPADIRADIRTDIPASIPAGIRADVRADIPANIRAANHNRGIRNCAVAKRLHGNPRSIRQRRLPRIGQAWFHRRWRRLPVGRGDDHDMGLPG